MTDIVEKLRLGGPNALEVCEEAADLITALRAENEKLRAALRESADELDAYYRAEYPGDHPYSQKKLEQALATNPARAALEKK